MKQLLLIISLILISSQSVARYSLFFCDLVKDSPSCSGTCKLEKNMIMDFKINADKNNIIALTYVDNKLASSLLLEDCKIVDKKNWQCSNSYIMVNDAWYVPSELLGMCGKYSIFK